ncbi:Methyltransf_12 domain-containing protein [Pycnococcus provasolii]
MAPSLPPRQSHHHHHRHHPGGGGSSVSRGGGSAQSHRSCVLRLVRWCFLKDALLIAALGLFLVTVIQQISIIATNSKYERATTTYWQSRRHVRRLRASVFRQNSTTRRREQDVVVGLKRTHARGSHGGVSGEMNTELQRRFEDVYTLNLWDDGVSRSGHGSNPRSEEVLRDKPFIVDVINKKFKGRRNTLTIVDAPCGDMAWMPETLRAISESFTHVYYTGFDIVPQIIRANQRQSFTQRAGNRVTLKFEVRDISSMRLPTADVVICRDVINHLPRRSIRAVLDNLRQSNIDYIILSNNFAPRGRPQVAEWARGFGANPQGGASRPIDVTKPPFNWPQPVERSQHLSLWENQIKESGDDQSQGGGGGFEFTAE